MVLDFIVSVQYLRELTELTRIPKWTSFHISFLLSVIDGNQLCRFSQILYINSCESAVEVCGYGGIGRHYRFRIYWK